MADDYSFAKEIKFFPILYAHSSRFDYYDWEYAMEDFLWGRRLESHIKIHFVRNTFSKCVSQWWIRLQQGNIERGEDPCRTCTGMKIVLRHRYGPPIEKKKVIAGDTIKVMQSSWSDSVIADGDWNVHKHKVIARHPIE